ncbi:non-ribosomal peptide synthetase [Streptomyces mirabilis]|uniref:non-ribosomal peptide synthetase n=1 Tax=Streptomyces mirabilis TaxID=68239 RepID=UPI0036DEF472
MVLDGHSGVLVLRRTAEIYTALREGRDPSEGALPGLAELHAAQAEYRASERFAADRAHWAGRMADRPEPVGLSLGLARQRGGTERTQGADDLVRSAACIPRETLDRLGATARLARTDWSTGLVAAVAAYLHRMTGQDDILLSLPVVGRVTEVARRTPGMTANILPLRIRADRDTTVHTLIRSALDETRQTLRHQQYRYEELLRDLRDGGSESAHRQFGPMVDIMGFDLGISFDGTLGNTHRLTSGPVEDLEIAACPVPGEGGLQIRLAGHPSRYTESELTAHLCRFARFLAAFAADPDALVGDVPLLLPGERERLLEEWNDTAVELRPATVHGLFEAQAATTPTRIALIHGEERLTYAELNARANRLAHRLIDQGAGPRTVVAVSLPPSVELVVALLAVMKSGAAYLPVDPGYQAERIAFMLEDVKSVAVLAEPADVRDTDGWSESNPAAQEGAVRHPAYVIHTSGSTGRPKGVVIRHEAVAGYLSYLHDLTGLGGDDTVLNLASVSFDPSVRDIFGPLTAGSRLVVAEQDEAQDPAALFALLRRHRVTVLPALTPTMLNALADAARDAEGEGDVPSPWLRMGLVSGEELTAAHLRRAASIGADWRLVNQYGPTESTMTATVHPVGPEDGAGGTRLPIGRPIANARCYVLDRWLRPVPPGATAELYLAGDDLADGYMNRRGLTAERFLADPYGLRPGARMYRTGDLASWRADGTLELHGRADDQVRLRGVRMELGQTQPEIPPTLAR